MEEKTIEVNGKKMSANEFQILQESISKTKDIQLIEIAPNCYKTKLFG